ncbi:MAG: hypothetical protein AAGI15_09595 [Pseudomonadota bacterium]
MRGFALPPYYHPTTLVLVDDSQSFLNSLERALPRDWPVRSFVEPEDALAFLNTPPMRPSLAERCLSVEPQPNGDPIIHFDAGLIEQEINHRERFERVSAAVIDYAMPSIDGLELCAAIEQGDLQRAMLTGVADEKVAVEAFNAGLLERFSSKQRLNSTTAMVEFMTEAKKGYFTRLGNRLLGSPALGAPTFLLEPAIASAVERLMAAHGLVEYYLVTDPPGLLLLNARGRLYRLLIRGADEMPAQTALAERLGAPTTIVSELAAGKMLTYLWDTPEQDFGDSPFPWEEHLQPAEHVAGRSDWLIALVEDPPMDIDFNAAESSFAAFLRER